MTEVRFPQLSETTDAEGTVATWFAEDGDHVDEGQLIAEVAVDKVDAEVTAPAAGTVEHQADEGDVIKQGSVIAVIT